MTYEIILMILILLMLMLVCGAGGFAEEIEAILNMCCYL